MKLSFASKPDLIDAASLQPGDLFAASPTGGLFVALQGELALRLAETTARDLQVFKVADLGPNLVAINDMITFHPGHDRVADVVPGVTKEKVPVKNDIVLTPQAEYFYVENSDTVYLVELGTWTAQVGCQPILNRNDVRQLRNWSIWRGTPFGPELLATY